MLMLARLFGVSTKCFTAQNLNNEILCNEDELDGKATHFHTSIR
jgi:hypothetical protein